MAHDLPTRPQRRAARAPQPGDPRHRGRDAPGDARRRHLAQRAQPAGGPGQVQRPALLRLARGRAARAAGELLPRVARASGGRAALGRRAQGRLQAPRRAAGDSDRGVAGRAPGAVRPHGRAGRGARAQRVGRGGHQTQARRPRRRRALRRAGARRAARAQPGRRLALRDRRLADDLGAVGARPTARGRPRGTRRGRAPRTAAPRLPSRWRTTSPRWPSDSTLAGAVRPRDARSCGGRGVRERAPGLGRSRRGASGCVHPRHRTRHGAQLHVLGRRRCGPGRRHDPLLVRAQARHDPDARDGQGPQLAARGRPRRRRAGHAQRRRPPAHPLHGHLRPRPEVHDLALPGPGHAAAGRREPRVRATGTPPARTSTAAAAARSSCAAGGCASSTPRFIGNRCEPTGRTSAAERCACCRSTTASRWTWSAAASRATCAATAAR